MPPLSTNSCVLITKYKLKDIYSVALVLNK